MKNGIVLLLSCVLGMMLGSSSSFGATRTKELVKYLKDFHWNPEAAMNQLPLKWDENGNLITKIETQFSPEDIKTGRYLVTKDKIRQKMCTVREGRRYCLQDENFESFDTTGISDEDKVEDLVEGVSIVKSLKAMESANLMKTRLDKYPWSESYWPIINGLTAIRYADPNFPINAAWSSKYAYVNSVPAPQMIAMGAADNLSPAEKYDYLVGDSGYNLTAANWNIGKVAAASWEGICDGWSAASVTFPEPIHSIWATGTSGQKVHFWPSDIKAMASLLWSKGSAPSNFIGHRCKISNAERDNVGRTINADCFDSNPGTFHMALVNQLGVAHRPVIIDDAHDIQIWNYPVWMYQYTYFNPQTLEAVDHWREAMVPMSQFTIDTFKNWRSPQARYVVGAAMDVTYMVEYLPGHSEGHHSGPHTVRYIYDLELDDNFTIIGGEWYSNYHPDFIWDPKVGGRSLSVSDPGLLAQMGGRSPWSGENEMPVSWTGAAVSASQQVQPLAVVVEKLVEMSK